MKALSKLSLLVGTALVEFSREILTEEGTSTPAPTPGTTPSPTPAPAPAPAPTPAGQIPTDLMVASAPNALAYDSAQTTFTTTHWLVTFPVIFGPDGTPEVRFSYDNVVVGDAPNRPGNNVYMDGMMLISPIGKSKSLAGYVTIPQNAQGVSEAFQPSDFGLTEWPRNQTWQGKAIMSVERAGDYLPGSLKIRGRENYSCTTMDARGGNQRPYFNECPIPQIVSAKKEGARSFLIAGHSWFKGTDTISGELGSSFTLGMLVDIGEKAMAKNGVVIPFINASRYGYTLQAAFDTVNDPWIKWAPRVTDMIDGTGYNETGKGLAAVMDNHKRLWAAAKAANKTLRIHAMAIVGKDLHKITGGQFPGQYDAFLEQSLKDGLIDGIIRLDSIRDPADRNLIKPGFLDASDHPIPGVGVEAIAAEIRKLVFG